MNNLKDIPGFEQYDRVSLTTIKETTVEGATKLFMFKEEPEAADVVYTITYIYTNDDLDILHRVTELYVLDWVRLSSRVTKY